MVRIKLISKKDQGHYKAGQVIRHSEIEIGADLTKITEYYDYEVIAELA